MLNDSIATKRIYTNLDSLFDTELTFLDLIDSRLSREYLSNEYNIENSYLYISYDSFKELYKERDNRVLKLSKSTAVADLIRNIVDDIDIKRKDGRFSPTKIVITINTYPYKLNEQETNDMLTFYKKYFLFVEEINLIYKETLSKAFVNKLSVIIDRNGLEWYMNTKIKDLSFRCPHVRLIIPDRHYYSNFINSLGVDVQQMFKYLETTLMSEVRLDVIEKETFMLKISHTKDEI